MNGFLRVTCPAFPKYIPVLGIDLRGLGEVRLQQCILSCKDLGLRSWCDESKVGRIQESGRFLLFEKNVEWKNIGEGKWSKTHRSSTQILYKSKERPSAALVNLGETILSSTKLLLLGTQVLMESCWIFPWFRWRLASWNVCYFSIQCFLLMVSE